MSPAPLRRRDRAVVVGMILIFVCGFALLGVLFLPSRPGQPWSPADLLPLGLLIIFALLFIAMSRRPLRAEEPPSPQLEAGEARMPVPQEPPKAAIGSDCA